MFISFIEACDCAGGSYTYLSKVGAVEMCLEILASLLITTMRFMIVAAG